MITWFIKEIESDKNTGGVITVCIAYKGQNGDKKDCRWERISFFPDSTAEDFIAFSSLTEQVVLDWVFAKHGNEWKAQREHELNKFLGLVSDPIISVEVPWL